MYVCMYVSYEQKRAPDEILKIQKNKVWHKIQMTICYFI